MSTNNGKPIPVMGWGVRVLLSLVLTGFVLGSFATAQAPECGYDKPIVFADLDWDSALLNNYVARAILEEGFGCETDSIPGSTVPMQQGMIRGDIDVNIEVWLDNIPDFYPQAVEDGDIVELSVIFDDAIQGWYVPRYMVEGDAERGIEAVAPDLRSVEDMPQYAELFRDPEQPNKGRFHNCILGWQCELINNVKLEAYGLTDYYTNFLPGTATALAASMEGEYLRGEPWFGYYWEPTWVLGKLDMLRLEEPPYTEECWAKIEAGETSEACAYPASVVITAVSGEFASKADPAIIEFLDAIRTDSASLNALLAYMNDNDATPEDAADYFLETQPEVWSQWVPEDVAERVKAAY